MRLIADFHLHSKHSRATSRNLDFENLYVSARIKGVHILGTGDFSHPAWFAEIQHKLEVAEAGLFKLKDQFVETLNAQIPASCVGMVRFVLVTEISNIYKRDGKTRRNHNLVFVPDLDIARKLNRKLKNIGNIESDGRPILGLDARDLLQVVLDTCPESFLIPAHIWTPWFSMLGSKSGFDTVEECFGNLSDFVFAAETGLSSDPAMNWRVSGMDHLSLISNSDAHSPSKIGREANIFDIDPSYFAMREALQNRDSPKFLGTIEFYPEEGKYHLDGHRSCGVRLEPRDTLAHKEICPKCGKPLTVGVLHRIEKLADRPVGEKPKNARPYVNLIPLIDILSEILQVGQNSAKVSRAYQTAIETLGPELTILQDLPPDLIENAGIPLLGEAVKRMREKKVDIIPGFDGEYGRIKIFNARDLQIRQSQRFLFGDACPRFIDSNTNSHHAAIEQLLDKKRSFAETESFDTRSIGERKPNQQPINEKPQTYFSNEANINTEQQKVIECDAGALLVVAGPGTGKTHTLTCRIAHQISKKGIPADSILALTFTNKAAEEMRSRLIGILSQEQPLPFIGTFHSLCLTLLRELYPKEAFSIIDEDEQSELIAEALVRVARSGIRVELKRHSLQAWIMQVKQRVLSPDDMLRANENTAIAEGSAAVYRVYQELLEIQHVYDYEELIYRVVKRLESDPLFCRSCRERFPNLYVDEYQDLNHGQYRLIRSLMPATNGDRRICVIGDPDQSIYGFRGSDCAYFRRFVEDYPGSVVLPLTRNYRSSDTILSASYQVISRDRAERVRIHSTIDGFKTISVLELPNERAEAESIAHVIENMIGGTGFHAIDTGRVREADPSIELSYSDFAVLTRTNEQIRLISDKFMQAGIPCQAVSRRNVSQQDGLSRLLALFKLISGSGSYVDFESIAGIIPSPPGKKAVAAFKKWCLQNRFSLKVGLARAARFPIPGVARQHQHLLVEFANHISGITNETASMDVGRKLTHLSRKPYIFPMIDNEEAQENLKLLASMGDSKMGADVFLQKLALNRDADFYHPRAEKVALMSMHAAKGLEFTVVFIAGCEDDLIPLHTNVSDIAEERRLFYVAMTRAKQRLYFTYARRRRLFGKTLSREPSPFIRDIENRLLKTERRDGAPMKKRPDQLQLF